MLTPKPFSTEILIDHYCKPTLQSQVSPMKWTLTWHARSRSSSSCTSIMSRMHRQAQCAPLARRRQTPLHVSGGEGVQPHPHPHPIQRRRRAAASSPSHSIPIPPSAPPHTPCSWAPRICAPPVSHVIAHAQVHTPTPPLPSPPGRCALPCPHPLPAHPRHPTALVSMQASQAA